MDQNEYSRVDFRELKRQIGVLPVGYISTESSWNDIYEMVAQLSRSEQDGESYFRALKRLQAAYDKYCITSVTDHRTILYYNNVQAPLSEFSERLANFVRETKDVQTRYIQTSPARNEAAKIVSTVYAAAVTTQSLARGIQGVDFGSVQILLRRLAGDVHAPSNVKLLGASNSVDRTPMLLAMHMVGNPTFRGCCAVAAHFDLKTAAKLFTQSVHVSRNVASFLPEGLDQRALTAYMDTTGEQFWGKKSLLERKLAPVQFRDNLASVLTKIVLTHAERLDCPIDTDTVYSYFLSKITPAEKAGT